MIPDSETPLSIQKKTAQVVSQASPIEKHGDKRKVFTDLLLKVLIEPEEINDLLDPNKTMSQPPSDLLYDQETKALRLGSLEQVGKLREKISGGLTLTTKSGALMEFTDAHLVGSKNHFSVMTGAHGVLTMNFRIDPKASELAKIQDLVEYGETVMTFLEVLSEDDKTPPSGKENQEDLPV